MSTDNPTPQPVADELVALRRQVADLTEQLAACQETETQLRDREARFRDLAEASYDAVVISEQGLVIDANPQLTTLLGYDLDEVIGKFTGDFVFPEDRELVKAYQRTGFDKSYYHRVVRKDGTVFYAEARGRVATYRGRMVRVTTLRDVTQQQEQAQRLSTFYALAENAPDGIGVAQLDGTLIYANEVYRTMTGYDSGLVGMSLYRLYAEDAPRVTGLVQEVLAQGMWKGLLLYRRRDDSTFPGQVSIFLIRGSNGRPQALGTIVRDITEQLRAEKERQNLQEEVIHAQQATLRELSTPLIPLADGVIALPLVGTIDSARAQQVMDTLLSGIGSYQAETAILDITGVKVVDTQVANALLRVAQAAKLLGARVVLTGIRPEVAEALVLLGADLSQIVTRSNLQSGIAYAMTQR